MKYTYINQKRIFIPNSKEELLDFISTEKKILITINPEMIMNEESAFVEIVNSNIAFPDGIGAVLALRRKGYNSIRIPGVEFWLEVIKYNCAKKSFYLIGGKKNIIEQTVEKLRYNYPQINILGYNDGYFTGIEEEILINNIATLKPDIVFVAMGTPKQEYLMDKLIKVHPALYMGLGGSFDVYSGNVKRAPKIFQVLGLEWSYRLLKEPSRIFRQIVLLKYFIKLLKNEI